MSFKTVAKKIAKKENLPLKNANAILANAGRNASPKAKANNPNLNKIKGGISVKPKKVVKKVTKKAAMKPKMNPTMKPKMTANEMFAKMKPVKG